MTTPKHRVSKRRCNFVINMVVPEGKVLDDSSAMKSFRSIVKWMSKNWGIKFTESKPPETIDSSERKSIRHGYNDYLSGNRLQPT